MFKIYENQRKKTTYRQIVGTPMGTNCAPFLADLFCYEGDFMLSLSDVEALRYIDALLNIDIPYFEQVVSQIHVYPTELQLNKANSSYTEAPFWA